MLWLCQHSQVFREEGLIYMVLEYGDIDLARLLHNHEEARRKGGGSEGEIDENFIRLYWQQMLQVGTAFIGPLVHVETLADAYLCPWSV